MDPVVNTFLNNLFKCMNIIIIMIIIIIIIMMMIIRSGQVGEHALQ